MPVYKFSWIFGVTTQVSQPTFSVAHSGGWSESFWDVAPVSVTSSQFIAESQARARILGRQCAIVGWRQSIFNISGNRLIPSGSSSGRLLYPGGSRGINLPQDSLELSIPANNPPGGTRAVLRGIPDDVVETGEFAPDPVYANQLSMYYTAHFSVPNHGWVGRDITQSSARVLSLHGGTLVLDAPLPATSTGDFIRLSRVRDDDGNPVIGSFRVTAAPVGSTYLLAGVGAVDVTNPSGTARKDVLAFSLYAHAPTRVRALPRKIGRPTESYRGRRSRAR